MNFWIRNYPPFPRLRRFSENSSSFGGKGAPKLGTKTLHCNTIDHNSGWYSGKPRKAVRTDPPNPFSFLRKTFVREGGQGVPP